MRSVCTPTGTIRDWPLLRGCPSRDSSTPSGASTTTCPVQPAGTSNWHASASAEAVASSGLDDTRSRCAWASCLRVATCTTFMRSAPPWKAATITWSTFAAAPAMIQHAFFVQGRGASRTMASLTDGDSLSTARKPSTTCEDTPSGRAPSTSTPSRTLPRAGGESGSIGGSCGCEGSLGTSGSSCGWVGASAGSASASTSAHKDRGFMCRTPRRTAHATASPVRPAMWPFSADEATWRPRMRALRPDYLFSGGRVLSGASLVVQDGVVQGVGDAPAGAELVPMRGRALLPGMVVAHSHAFQRAIRGRTEHRSPPTDDGSTARAKDDFWSWREAMYAAAERLTPQDLHAVSKFCFLEMARAGITAVGEFHYLHRDASGKPYADPNELDLAVARAAREVGLRIVLLRVAYARSGFRVPENPRQKRFIEGSAEEYLRNLDALSRHVAVGAAPHSVRACPAEWIRDISQEAFRRGWPLHLHVAEQRGEVEQCQAEHGTTPGLLLGTLRD